MFSRHQAIQNMNLGNFKRLSLLNGCKVMAHSNLRHKGKGKGNLFYVKNTGSGCPSLPSQGLMIEVFDIHVKRKKKKKRFKNYILKNTILLYY